MTAPESENVTQLPVAWGRGDEVDQQSSPIVELRFSAD
jgi:hypothetical protein